MDYFKKLRELSDQLLSNNRAQQTQWQIPQKMLTVLEKTQVTRGGWVPLAVGNQKNQSQLLLKTFTFGCWIIQTTVLMIKMSTHGYKGYASLSNETDDIDIRIKILDLVNAKFPEVTNFDFLKRERNSIFVPFVPSGWKWCFDNIKSLSGQGKLYIRLCSPCRTILSKASRQGKMGDFLKGKTDELSSGDDSPLPQALDSPLTPAFDSPPTPAFDSTDHDYAQRFINEVLDSKQENLKKFSSLSSAMSFLTSKVGLDKKRLRVEQEFALEEALQLVKSGDFDEKEKLVVSYKKQPAIDTGGVLRQFYSHCFSQMMGDGRSSDFPTILEGNENYKVPVCNPSVMLSGIMVLVGKIFSHALVQGQIGISCLAPCIYEYLATGELSFATGLLSLDDYFDDYLKDVNKRVWSISYSCYVIFTF